MCAVTLPSKPNQFGGSCHSSNWIKQQTIDRWTTIFHHCGISLLKWSLFPHTKTTCWVFPKIGVSPTWTVYNGKPLLKWMILGGKTHYFRKHPAGHLCEICFNKKTAKFRRPASRVWRLFVEYPFRDLPLHPRPPAVRLRTAPGGVSYPLPTEKPNKP